MIAALFRLIGWTLALVAVLALLAAFIVSVLSVKP